MPDDTLNEAGSGGLPLVVCLPTYNERENLEAMLCALRDVLPPGGRVLVIDDSSPDGTGELAESLRSRLPFVDVLHRPQKQGLGPAYLAGFRWALERGAATIVEMDCDFSHDPAVLPQLLSAAQSADVVIGSRYVAGGAVPDWSLLRRVISRFGCLYARTLLGVSVHDLTGGFKCFRRSALERIPLGSIAARGYMFQIEMTYEAQRAGCAIVEVPITFADRRRGRSKMGGAIVLEAFWRVPLLRLRSLRPADRRPALVPDRR